MTALQFVIALVWIGLAVALLGLIPSILNLRGIQRADERRRARKQNGVRQHVIKSDRRREVLRMVGIVAVMIVCTLLLVSLLPAADGWNTGLSLGVFVAFVWLPIEMAANALMDAHDRQVALDLIDKELEAAGRVQTDHRPPRRRFPPNFIRRKE